MIQRHPHLLKHFALYDDLVDGHLPAAENESLSSSDLHHDDSCCEDFSASSSSSTFNDGDNIHQHSSSPDSSSSSLPSRGFSREKTVRINNCRGNRLMMLLDGCPPPTMEEPSSSSRHASQSASRSGGRQKSHITVIPNLARKGGICPTTTTSRDVLKKLHFGKAAGARSYSTS